MAKRRGIPYLPDEVLSSILKRLPVKDILRFKTVGKPWLALLTSTDFSKLHFNYRQCCLCLEDRALMLVSEDCLLCATSIDRLKSPAVKVNLEGITIVDIVGSCNGLLLCVCKDEGSESDSDFEDDELVVINPATCDYRKIPIFKRRDDREPLWNRINIYYGLGYDNGADDYKVVWIGVTFKKPEVRVMVFSLKAYSWKSINAEIPPDAIPFSERFYGALVNDNLLHWSFWVRDDQSSRLFCFDVCSERWTEVPLPDEILCVTNIGILDGCLCVQALQRGCTGDRNIWVLRDYAVKDKWTKLLSDFESRDYLALPPVVACLGGGKKLLLRRPGRERGISEKLSWYDLRRKRATKAEVSGVPTHRRTTLCVRSLVRLCCYGKTDDEIQACSLADKELN